METLDFQIQASRSELKLDQVDFECGDYISELTVYVGKPNVKQIRIAITNRFTEKKRFQIINSECPQEEIDQSSPVKYTNNRKQLIFLFQVIRENAITQLTCKFTQFESLNGNQVSLAVQNCSSRDQFNQIQLKASDITFESNENFTDLKFYLFEHLTNFLSILEFRQLIPKEGFSECKDLDQEWALARQEVKDVITKIRDVQSQNSSGHNLLKKLDDCLKDLKIRMTKVLDEREGLSIAALAGFKSEITKLNVYAALLAKHIEETDELYEKVNKRGSNNSLDDIINSKLRSEQDFINEDINIRSAKNLKQENSNRKQKISSQMSKIKIAIESKQTEIDSIKRGIILKEQEIEMLRKQNQERLKEHLKYRPQYTESDPQSNSQLNEEIDQINKAQNEEQIMSNKLIKEREYQLQARIQSFQDKIENDQKNCNDYTKCHHIFVIDESDSMKEVWPSLQKIFEQQAQSANVVGSQHMFSLIMFSTKADLVKKKVKAGDLGSLRALSGGGTNFLPAFEKIKDLLALNPDRYTPIVQFLTDGKDERVDSKKLISMAQEMKKQTPKLQFFAIGFGKEYNKEFLSKLCFEVNGGQYLKIKDSRIEYCSNAEDVSALEQIFHELATMYENTYEEKQIQHLAKLLKDQETEQRKNESRISEFFQILRDKAVERGNWMKNLKKEEFQQDQSVLTEWKKGFQNKLDDQETLMTRQLETQRNNLAKTQEILEGNKNQEDQLMNDIAELDKEMKSINNLLEKFDNDKNRYLNLNYDKIGMTTPEQMKSLLDKYSSISQETSLLKRILGKLSTYYQGIKNNLDGIIEGLSFTEAKNIDRSIDSAMLQKQIKEYYSSNYSNELQNSSILKNSIKILLQIKNKSKFIQLKPYYKKLYGELNVRLAQISLSNYDERRQIIEELVKKALPIDDEKSSGSQIKEAVLKKITLSRATDKSKSLCESETLSESSTTPAPQVSFNEGFLTYAEEKDFEKLKTKTQVANQINRIEQKIVKIVQKINNQGEEVDVELEISKIEKLTELYDFCKEITEVNIVTGRIETLVGLIKEIIEGPIVSLFKSQQFKNLEQQFESFSQISKPRISIMDEITYVLTIERPDSLRQQQSMLKNIRMIKEEIPNVPDRLQLKEDQ